ncbi:MAG: type II toxin-antitoxin system RelE/ParE family toxin [Planctomycetia bacterium]|jgi:toxin ParE1/3/4
MPRLELSRDARQDLLEIAAYIARESGSGRRGDAFLDAVFATCQTLASQPEMGQLRTEFATGEYRSFSVGSYVIFFQPTRDGILVARVLHGSRDHYSVL